jgi:glucose/arabinose dehydrogenase
VPRVIPPFRASGAFIEVVAMSRAVLVWVRRLVVGLGCVLAWLVDSGGAALGQSGAGQGELPALATQVAFPNLRFDRPVALAYPDDGSGLLYVVEQHTGRIYCFPNEAETSEKQLFLELPSAMNKDNEEGLLGLAFHPKYRENGQFYVYYSAADRGQPRKSVVSRFLRSSGDARKADPASETRIWVSAADPYSNHNGGCILFGPDGYLYISLGDSGAADDPLTTGQNPKDWFGSILRIDVDHPADGKAYGIPQDNPRLRDGKAYRDWAPEVYCIGLRNVWKFSFDRATGDLWAGDVGQNLWEIVHKIENGGNYGWSIKEGFHDFRPRQRRAANTKLSAPIAEYSHELGKSITGGYVYRGPSLPELTGAYVYGDFETGRIWGLRERAGKPALVRELIDLGSNPRLNIAAFGEDPAGELYLLAFDGRIHRLVPRR